MELGCPSLTLPCQKSWGGTSAPGSTDCPRAGITPTPSDEVLNHAGSEPGPRGCAAGDGTLQSWGTDSSHPSPACKTIKMSWALRVMGTCGQIWGRERASHAHTSSPRPLGAPANPATPQEH